MRAAAVALLVSLAASSPACKRPPARGSEAPPAPAGVEPAPPPVPSPGAAGGAPDPRQLLAQVDALKERIAASPKSVEIMVALGNLYLENQRPLEAIDWYRQAIEAGERDPTGHATLLGRARARRANAFLLAGNEQQAIAGHEANLRKDPRQPDSLFFLGAILAALEPPDPDRLRRADRLLRRYLGQYPGGDHAGRARETLAGLEGRLGAAPSSAGQTPVAPARSH